MADSFSKKEREKKKEKKRKEKAERRQQKNAEGPKPIEFMYVDQDGNFSAEKPVEKKPIKAEDIEIGIPKRESADDDPIKKGTVKFFDTEKGYGFISGEGSYDSYFVHVSNLVDTIKDNDKVIFEVEMGPKGPVAVNVKLA